MLHLQKLIHHHNKIECKKLITFDKGFKKFYTICGVEIEIL